MDDLTSAKTERLPEPPVESRSGLIRSLENELHTYKKRYNRVLEITLSIAAVVLLATIAVLLRSDIHLYYVAFLRPLLVYWPNAAGVVAILVISFNLINLKWFAPRYYNILEVAAAVVIGWIGMSRIMASSYPDGIALVAAAIYLAKQGMENALSKFYSKFKRFPAKGSDNG